MSVGPAPISQPPLLTESPAARFTSMVAPTLSPDQIEARASLGALMSSIAVINAGSSSIKFAVFQATSSPSLVLRGQIEGIGTAPRAKLSDPGGKLLVEESFEDKNFDHAAATQAMMRIGAQWLGGRDMSAVG